MAACREAAVEGELAVILALFSRTHSLHQYDTKSDDWLLHIKCWDDRKMGKETLDQH
jgi:hypothetical protein